MKMEVERPTKSSTSTACRLAKSKARRVAATIGVALVRNSDLAYHPLVERCHPVLASAVLAGASQQLRNMASTGGNLLQRTRCAYFYDTVTPCNKREPSTTERPRGRPGSGCSAMHGHNRMHAILGASDACIAVHPSDMAVAFSILEAKVHVTSASGDRVIEFADFHRLPGDTPQRDTNLNAGEIITAIELPPRGLPVKNWLPHQRAQTALPRACAIPVAVGLELDGGVVAVARLALGGIAHKPWRDRQAEAALRGQPPNAESFSRAADILLRDAKGHEHNKFKIDLTRCCIVRALTQASLGTPQAQSSKKIA